ncbi:MAG: porin family protein [Rhizobiales bacterium]|nr:porin family protein [Hyphomicrobiales bacterium]
MICVTRDNSAAARRRRWRLRAGVAMLAVILLAPAAAAADLDDFPLRGSYSDMFSTKSYSRWDGWNFGVQAGVANMDTDFSNAATQWIADSLNNTVLKDQVHPENWALLSNNIAHGQSYGAFLGYNFQWDQLVVGFDMAYNYTSSMNSSSSATPIPLTVTFSCTTPDPAITTCTDTVARSATASLKLVDHATVRGRAGYAFGQFLPYAFVGGAVGRFDYAATVTLAVSGYDNIPLTRLTTTKNGAIVGGFTAGLGMDVALLPNVFVRGEWEFVGFAPISGIRANLNTARVALGVKF